MGSLAGGIIFVHIDSVGGGPPTVSSVTVGGQACAEATPSQTFQDAGNPQRQALYYLVNPPTGAVTVAVTMSAAGELVVTALSYVGVDPSNPFGTILKTATNSGSSLSVNLTSQINGLCVDFFSCKNVNAAMTPGAGQTVRANIQSNDTASSNMHRDESSEEAGAASVSMSWTFTAARAAGLIGVPLLPLISERPRLVKNFANTYDPKRRVIDNQGRTVRPGLLKAGEWFRNEGPFLIKANKANSLIEIPSVGFIESVKEDERSQVNKETMFQTLMRRLGGRAA
jgi:hypothetical protein